MGVENKLRSRKNAQGGNKLLSQQGHRTLGPGCFSCVLGLLHAVHTLLCAHVWCPLRSGRLRGEGRQAGEGEECSRPAECWEVTSPL